MATRQWSLTDHVSVENGSPTVTAEAAVWLVTAKPGNGISFDGGSKYYEILTVDSNTQITLADDFAETTISDGSVLIDNRGNGYTPAEVEVIQLYKDVVLNQIDLFKTTGKPPDTRGGDGSIGWDGPNRVWYQKTNGTWGDPQSLGGADGMDAGFKFKIDKLSVSMADPGSGKFRLNNAAAASVTAIAFDDISADFGSPDVSAYLATWAQSANTIKGHLIFHEVGATQNFLVYAITGLVDNTGWTQVNVSHVASGGSIDDGDELAIAFIRAGDKGDPGVQAGIRFKFATMTGMVDPGTGFLRFNSNTYASITAVAISDLCAATGNPDVSASILSWDNSGNTQNKGVLRIAKQDAEQTFIELAIVGTTTDNTGWSQLNVQYLSGNGTFATNDQIVISFYRTGDDGWSPVFSIADDADRRVLEVTDWTGGVGTKPAVGKYVGTSGFVDDIEDGADIRGPQGIQGQGIQPDATGTLAERDALDGAPKGFIYLSTDGDGASITTACIFVKNSATSGDWSDGVPQGGLPADDDPTLAANSDDKVATQKATKTYVDSATQISTHIGQAATGSRIASAKNATNKQIMSRTRHLARDRIATLKLVFANWYIDKSNSHAETGVGAVLSVSSSIEYPIGTFTAAKFSAASTGSVPDGGTLVSDDVAVDIPDGAEFYVLSYATSTAGVIFSENIDPGRGEIANYAASGLTDLTLTGGVSDGGSNIAYYPVAVVATTHRPSVLVIGDSRSAGGAADAIIFNPNSQIGWLPRALANDCGLINTAVSGERLSYTASSVAKRASLVAYATDVVIQLGINDFSNGRTSAQAFVDLGIIISALGSTAKIWLTTVEPKSTSSDSFATISGQTTDAGNSQRATFNDTIRGGITGVAGYFETADVVESSRNSGKWSVDGIAGTFTADGLHCSNFGECYLAASGAIDTRLFSKAVAPRFIFATDDDVSAGIASDRVVSPSSIADHITISESVVTLANSTAVQDVFPAGQNTVDLKANTLYLVEAQIWISRGTTSSGLTFSFNASAAASMLVFSEAYFFTLGTPSNAAPYILNLASAFVQSQGTVLPATSSNLIHLRLRGRFKTSEAVSVRPQIAFSAAPGGSPVVNAGSYMIFRQLGTKARPKKGNWR